MMANRSNYRVKVDLSKYHQDARRFSWMYIDSINIWLISHVKQHIVDMFGISEPFHILLNGNEYLPPNEDVRVLKENEVIVVVPGTGVSDRANTSSASMSSSAVQISFVKQTRKPTTEEVTNNSQCSVKHSSAPQSEQDSQSPDDSVQDINMGDATVYHSMLETSLNESISASESNEKNDSIIEESGLNDLRNTSSRKRKRVRRKKVNKVSDACLIEKNKEQVQKVLEKPKIINSCVLPIGKHIRFENSDDLKNTKVDNLENNPPIKIQKTNANVATSLNNSQVTNLSTLLALRNSSTPLTFNSKRAPVNVANGHQQKLQKNNKTETSETPKNIETVASETNGRNYPIHASEGDIDYLRLNPELYQKLEKETKLNDIVAFKILRIGKDCTPEISDNIIAKTVGWCPKSQSYTFKIIKGQEQIQIDIGKFALPDNEESKQETDTVTFAFPQLIEPRLIYRKIN